MPALPIGPVGQTVARNARELARARGLKLREMSALVTALGRRMAPSVLHAVGQGTRRVDADDLVALAIALDVNPGALLLPRDTSPDAEVELAAGVRVPAWAAWAWADGRLPLPADQEDGTPGERFGREVDFLRTARPAFLAFPGALAAVYELADRIEAWGASGDPVIRGALRDRVIKQARKVMLQLEEESADDDTGQFREAARALTPAVDYVGPPPS